MSYIMLDWMTMSPTLRATHHLEGTKLDHVTRSNDVYTQVNAGHYYATKGGSGWPWDIKIFDGSYIYESTTENGWTAATMGKRFESLDPLIGFKGVPLAKRIMNIGDSVLSSDGRYMIYTACGVGTEQNDGHVKCTLWGPYTETIPGAGGNLPPGLTTLRITYEWGLDSGYNHQTGSVKETNTFCQPYGWVRWQSQNWNVGAGAYDSPNDESNMNILVAGVSGIPANDPCGFGVDGSIGGGGHIISGGGGGGVVVGGILTLKTIPGYTDLSDSVLAAGQPARGLHLEAISANAAFGMVRTEVFQGLYFDGDTVPLPVSPIDGYVYTREELVYFYNIAVSTNKATGWIQGGSGSLWFTNWFVDQSSGVVSSLEWYRNTGSGGTRTSTTDGHIIVYTLTQRQRQNLIQSVTPTFSAISTGDIATNKPWSQSLAQGLNENAKFCVTNKEIFYCGEFTDGAQVPRGAGSALVSPADGYQYAYAECKFLGFWRWTSIGSALTQPPENFAFLGPFAWAIDSSGNVSMYMERMDNDGNDHIAPGYGRMSIMAFCTRAATPSSASLANAFSEVSEANFVPGNTLRASNVLQINENINEAILTPEFFGVTEYASGDTVSTPISPVDGYTYSRDELTYVWAWSAVRPAAGTGQVRIPIFYGSVDQFTGLVTLACWRLTNRYLDDDNTWCRIKVVIVARRNGHNSNPILPITPNPPSDWPTNEAVHPYALSSAWGGARATPPATGEILLVHIMPTILTGMDKVRFPAGLPGSTAGCRTAPALGYSVDILLNGGLVGKIIYSSTVGTFSFAGPLLPDGTNDVLMSPGDTLSFVGEVADTTILGLFWTMIGNRY